MKMHCKRSFAMVFFLLSLIPQRVHGETISYQYDRLNRLTSALYEDGTRIVYVYDAAGNRLSLVIGDCSENAGVRGDLDGDCAVTLGDVIAALQVLAGKEAARLRANFAASGADVDGNRKIDFQDLLYILQAAAMSEQQP